MWKDLFYWFKKKTTANTSAKIIKKYFIFAKTHQREGEIRVCLRVLVCLMIFAPLLVGFTL